LIILLSLQITLFSLQEITPQQVAKQIPLIRKAPILILDANLGLETINFVLEECENAKEPI
jgi:hypothetical protein